LLKNEKNHLLPDDDALIMFFSPHEIVGIV